MEILAEDTSGAQLCQRNPASCHSHISNWTPTFLSFHLDLLSTLNKDFHADVSCKDDLSLARQFLQKRAQIMALKKELLQSLSIQGEAHDLSKTLNPLPKKHSLSRSQLNKTQYKIPSPFATVALLLTIESDNQSALLKSHQAPFLPLLESTRRRVTALRLKVHQQRSDVDTQSKILIEKLLRPEAKKASESSDSSAFDVERSLVASTTFQLTLWHLLSNELETVLS